MPEDHTRHDVLARITDNPQLARAVPLLRPDVLHAVIAHYGLLDCGALIALATPQQLSAVFDLDLWKAPRSGAVEQFDPARFLEWLEVLVDVDPATAADRLAQQDVALVVAGLSPSITVWDPAVFSSVEEPTGADAVVNAGRERGAHVDVGGYLVVARRTEAWDAIVEVLMGLEKHHSATFHHVMRACRRLSDSGRELDGLDDLLPDAEQLRFDMSLGREKRRDLLGYLPPEQARAFLDAARGVSLAAGPPATDAVFVGYMQTVAPANASEAPADLQSADAEDTPAESAAHVAEVIRVLRGAGVILDPRRALPPGVQGPLVVGAALQAYLDGESALTADGWMAREQALGFLANALVAGCSVQGRSFTPREASDAVVATCNLGLECWPQQWPPAATQDLVTVFRVGWAVLQRDVSMIVARRLLDALGLVQTSDRDLQLGLRALARELRKHAKAGTPWRARAGLDVLASLDLPAWAALTALFGECPVMLANVSAPHDRRPHALDPSAFQFIAEAAHVAAIREFLQSLPEVLTS
jgi:Family of unknown function (DUF6178)